VSTLDNQAILGRLALMQKSDSLVDGFGSVLLWGFSPAVGVLDSSIVSVLHRSGCSDPFNVVFVNSGDARHVIETLSHLPKRPGIFSSAKQLTVCSVFVLHCPLPSEDLHHGAKPRLHRPPVVPVSHYPRHASRRHQPCTPFPRRLWESACRRNNRSVYQRASRATPKVSVPRALFFKYYAEVAILPSHDHCPFPDLILLGPPSPPH